MEHPGGGLVLKLIHVDYENITFCDSTNNICVDMGSASGDVDTTGRISVIRADATSSLIIN
jgi:hypothetical protein